MVYAGLRDARPYIPDPPPAQSAPDPHDEENMDARPDQEKMEQAINKLLQLLEKQEKKGYKDLLALWTGRARKAEAATGPDDGTSQGGRGGYGPAKAGLAIVADMAPGPGDGTSQSGRLLARGTWPQYCHSCPSLHKGPLAPCLWPRL